VIGSLTCGSIHRWKRIEYQFSLKGDDTLTCGATTGYRKKSIPQRG